MKFLALATLLIGSTSFACPNLAGKFNCGDQNSPSTLTIEQSVENDITTYKVTQKEQQDEYTFTAVADGVKKTTTEKDQNGTTVIDETYTCTDTTLIDDATETVTSEDNSVYSMHQLVNVSIDGSNNLQIASKTDDSEGNNSENSQSCARLE